MRMLWILAFAVACGGGSSGGSAAPQAPVAPAEPAASPSPAPAAKPSFEERALALMTALIAVFETSGTDCAKLAAGIHTYLDQHAAELDAMKEHEKQMTPEQKKAWDKRLDEQTESMAEKLLPSIDACANDEKVQAAMSRLTEY